MMNRTELTMDCMDYINGGKDQKVTRTAVKQVIKQVFNTNAIEASVKNQINEAKETCSRAVDAAKKVFEKLKFWD